MEFLVGFLIAVAIAVTGVGAGTLTAPLLIFFLHVPLGVAVCTALVYASVIKLLVLPVQIVRRKINYRVAGWMLAGGLPGVVLGSLMLRRFVLVHAQRPLYAVLGVIIVVSSAWHLWRHFRPGTQVVQGPPRLRRLAAFMLPVGFEVGLSSSGAGALGSLALMGFTSLTPSEVVGTDLAFGFALSLAGGGVHLFTGGCDSSLLLTLIGGGAVGVIAGSALAPHVPQRQLRLALAACLLLIGVQLCYRALQHLPAASALGYLRHFVS
ncbi:sulfite exporter TauE/SafE family protein [Acidipila rosea]|uniref:Probable membrane transporter protein n=1 Tax=Acidipila rosea TaxID=768535 RepID=A0A4R1L5V3_9BACT|nr:sulfite exporter TauE/SafE family protein [Acidipila rosea]MBW4026644.1 sulfite exporter TauE/SafE family protein [Acidobacteriota bacterium]MBW4044820.1 sulfite exporter TauE/SafE family protein [Acidobacteriota bacterium]TCK73526.1 hypothetical protein C7378_1139 [Acidipila rosea]